MRNSYAIYRVKSRIRLILMLIGVVGLIALVAFLFVYLIQREQPQKTVLVSNVNTVSVTSKEGTSSAVPSSGTGSMDEAAQLKDWRLILVNSTHKLPDNFDTREIVHAFDMDMDKRIVQPYTDMYKAALLDKVNLWISVAYRSPELQTKLFNNEIANNIKAGMSSSSATAAAKKAVAIPGYSEHHTGLAMDLNGVKPSFDQTKEFAWLQKHAADYGFILRYPKNKESITKIMYEPWHYRYVGPESAKKMNQMGMCLEEYVDYLKKNHLD